MYETLYAVRSTFHVFCSMFDATTSQFTKYNIYTTQEHKRYAVLFDVTQLLTLVVPVFDLHPFDF